MADFPTAGAGADAAVFGVATGAFLGRRGGGGIEAPALGVGSSFSVLAGDGVASGVSGNLSGQCWGDKPWNWLNFALKFWATSFFGLGVDSGIEGSVGETWGLPKESSEPVLSPSLKVGARNSSCSFVKSGAGAKPATWCPVALGSCGAVVAPSTNKSNNHVQVLESSDV